MTHSRNDGITDPAVKDEARTPPYLFAQLNARFGFTGDVAASDTNHLCPNYYTKERDALAQPWFRVSYCNPPYSSGWIEKFLKKAYEESLLGKIAVVLIPADLSTGYFRKYCMKAAEWIIIDGRVKFNHPDGTQMKGSPKFASIAYVFDRALLEKNGHLVVSLMKWR